MDSVPRRLLLPTLTLLLGVLAVGCSLRTSASARPRAWIDYPSSGMTFSPGTIVVLSHSTGPNAIAQVSLYVNGSEQRTDVNPDAARSLVALSHPWLPPGPGKYLLEVRALDAAGNEVRSLPVRMAVTGCPTPAGGGPPPAECEPDVPLVVATGVTPPGEVIVDQPVCTEPTATFSVNANCREGPGTAYPVRGSILSGVSAEIVGRTADGAWLMVRAASGACWVSAITLEACGDLNAVQVQEAALPPPAPDDQTQEEPPAQTQPAAPGALGVSEHVCQGTTYAVTLSWADSANNESGYRVYRNGALLANLGAGATSYTDNPPQGGPYTYKVEAYNGVGASSASTNDSGCLL